MNRTEVLEQMEPVLATRVREIEHTPATRIEVTPEMVGTIRPGRGARTIQMAEEGVRSMATFLGLPWTLAAQIHPATFSRVATELLGAKERYALVVKDDMVTGLAKSHQYHQLNAERVLRAIEAGAPGIDYHRVVLTGASTVSLEVVGERRQAVKRGDLIQAGANIVFSPLGETIPSVQSYVLRLVCTNGMTDNAVLRQFTYGGGGGGEGDDVWQWFRNSTREAYGALEGIVNRYRELSNERIRPEDRAGMLEAMLREARITGELAEVVRARALERPPTNRFQLLNLISYATSHDVEEPRRVRQGQLAVANHVAERDHGRICPVCHTQSVRRQRTPVNSDN